MRSKYKRIYYILIVVFVVMSNILFSDSIVYAKNIVTDKVIVDVVVSGDDNGKVKAGTEIEIVYNLSNLNCIYAASIDLTYDNSLIRVNSIEPGEKIAGNVFEAYKDTAKDGNRVRYAFTFLGSDEKGLSGKAEFIKIKATILRDGELNVKKASTKYEFVQKVGDEMKKVEESYMNSQGESVKVELLPNNQNVGQSNQGESSETIPNQKDNEVEKVTVVGENNTNSVVSNIVNNKKVVNEVAEEEGIVNEGSGSEKKLEEVDTTTVNEEENEGEEEGSKESIKTGEVDSEAGKRKIGLIVSISLVSVVALGSFGVIYLKKRKKI